MISKPKLLILSTTFERSVPHHNTPLQKQGFTQLKHTELICEAFLVLNCKNMYIPRAQALSKTFSQNPQTPLISSAFYSFLKMSSAAKQLTPTTRRSGKTKLVTGGTLSTTAQTYSWFSSPFR